MNVSSYESLTGFLIHASLLTLKTTTLH